MRGFASVGTGTSDNVTSLLTAHSSTRSYHIIANRLGPGSAGGGGGRMFDKSDGATEALFYDSGGGGNYSYFRGFSGNGFGWWFVVSPSTSANHAVGVSYNSSAAANVPIMYLDGVAQSLSTLQQGTGTATTNASAYMIGNRADFARNWDGHLGEFAAWDAILTAAEFAQLALGISALLVRPSALVEYIPLFGNATSTETTFKTAGASVGGALSTQHPRIVYPARSPSVIVTAAAAAAVPYAALMGATTTISGGRPQP